MRLWPYLSQLTRQSGVQEPLPVSHLGGHLLPVGVQLLPGLAVHSHLAGTLHQLPQSLVDLLLLLVLCGDLCTFSALRVAAKVDLVAHLLHIVLHSLRLVFVLQPEGLVLDNLLFLLLECLGGGTLWLLLRRHWYY